MRIEPSNLDDIEWILKRINRIKLPDAKGITAISDTGKVLAVCMMDSWTEGSVQLHIAIDNPIALKNYTFISEVFNYIFNTGDRLTALGFVSSENEKALKFDKRLGFKEIARIRDGNKKGIDTVILELRREDCRWINRKVEAA